MPDRGEARLLFMRQLVHDLNNALSVISINVTLLGQRDADGRETAELLEDVARASERASAITGQLRRVVAEASDPFRRAQDDSGARVS